jgi:hypothetical protein
VTILASGADADAGAGVCVDCISVELHEYTDLFIAPIADTEIAKIFGILVDGRDKEEADEANLADDGNRHCSGYVDRDLMENVVDNVVDAHDDEMVNFYHKKNQVIAVGKLFSSMDEFRICFKTYAIKKEFDAMSQWADKMKFYGRCRACDGACQALQMVHFR